MQSVEYAFKVFENHFRQATPPPHYVSLELEPGDSFLSAIFSKAFGGSTSYLIDSGYFASRDLKIYYSAEKLLVDKSLLSAYGISDKASVDAICETCSAHYLTDGLDSLRSLESQSIEPI